MKKTSPQVRAREILENDGQTYAEEAGIALKDAPAPLYQLLNLTVLLSARIPSGNAVQAAKALIEAGFTTPEKMAKTTWQDRVDVLTNHGYKRYDESGSTKLGDVANTVLETYGGDLRKLREQAKQNRRAEHKLLQQFKGIGPVGASIFLREVQGIWDEAYPYVDDRVTKAARAEGLPGDTDSLVKLVDRQDFPRFVASLVRLSLAGH